MKKLHFSLIISLTLCLKSTAQTDTTIYLRINHDSALVGMQYAAGLYIYEVISNGQREVGKVVIGK